jgi:hypothetical protein
LAERERERRQQATRKAEQAKRLWQEAQPIAGTIAEVYLRGITCPLPPALRFHPQAWHGLTVRRLPALVALIEGSDGFAVHRTYQRGWQRQGRRRHAQGDAGGDDPRRCITRGRAGAAGGGGPRPVSLYAMTVARSGERKSACDAPFMAKLRAHEMEQAKAQRDDTESWRNAQAIWKGERERILSDAKKGDGDNGQRRRWILLRMGRNPKPRHPLTGP